MTTYRGFASIGVATGLAALAGTLAAPIAHADTVDNIKATIAKDRAKTACPAYKYNPVLESIAQVLNTNNVAGVNQTLPVYNGDARSFPGFGDPTAAAVNDAYVGGFGPFISECRYTELGVSFSRAEHNGALKDFVEFVIGAPAAPVAAPPAAPAPPANPKPVRPIGKLHTATVTAAVDVYDNPSGNGKPLKFLEKGQTVTVVVPCTPDAFCALTDGTFAWGEFLKNN
jgi:hypothetical protein